MFCGQLSSSIQRLSLPAQHMRVVGCTLLGHALTDAEGFPV
jgi:hypothetical protein